MVGLWNPVYKGSVFGNLGPYKKQRVLAPTPGSKVLCHFVTWQLLHDVHAIYHSVTFFWDFVDLDGVLGHLFVRKQLPSLFLLFSRHSSRLVELASILFIRIPSPMVPMLCFQAWKNARGGNPHSFIHAMWVAHGYSVTTGWVNLKKNLVSTETPPNDPNCHAMAKPCPIIFGVGKITLLRVIPTMAFNSSHRTFCPANLLAFYLAYLLTFYPAFYLAYLLAFYLAYLLTFYLAYLLTFYLAYLL